MRPLRCSQRKSSNCVRPSRSAQRTPFYPRQRGGRGALLRSLSKEPDCNSLCYHTRSPNSLTTPPPCIKKTIFENSQTVHKAQVLLILHCQSANNTIQRYENSASHSARSDLIGRGVQQVGHDFMVRIRYNPNPNPRLKQNSVSHSDQSDLISRGVQQVGHDFLKQKPHTA